MLYLIIGTYLFVVSGFFHKNRFFDANCIVVLLFLSANHYNGFDWISYYYLYDSKTLVELLSVESLLESTSPGFQLVLALAKVIGSYNIVFVVSSIVFVYAVRRLAEQHDNKNIVLFLCFCFFGYYYYVERVKQGFSISLVILSISFLMREKRSGAWLFMLVAVLFHASALLALPLLAFPYHDKASKKNARVIGTVIILIFSVLVYFLVDPSLTSALPGILGYYLRTYATQITTGFNPGFFLSIGGLSFLFMLFIIYRIASTRPSVNTRNYAFFIYLFSYITSAYYGFIRVSNYYYPYVINVLSEYACAKRKNNIWRLFILLGALAQLLRPLSVPYYRDSIMGYQLWGISDLSPAEMQYIRCNSIFSADAYNELAIYSCAKKI